MKKMIKTGLSGWGLALTISLMLNACGGGGGGSRGDVPVDPGSSRTPLAIQRPVVLMEASSVDPGTITASWLPVTDNAAGQIRYQLHASPDAGFTPDPSTVKFEGVDVTSAILTTGLNPGSLYYVRVVAIDYQGKTVASNAIPVTISNIPAASRSGSSVQTLKANDVKQVTAATILLQPGVAVPSIGQYIASTDGSGFLRKVVSVSIMTSGTTIETQPAALDEVLATAQVSATFTLPSTTISTDSTATQAGFVVQGPTSSSRRHEFSWGQSQLRYSVVPDAAPGKPIQTGLASQAAAGQTTAKVFNGSGDFKVANAITTNFDPTISIEQRLGLTGVEYAKIVAKASPTIVQTLTISSSSAGTMDKTLEVIPPRQFTKIFMVGPVPLEIRGVFKVDMRIKGDISGALEATEKISLSYNPIEYGFKYENGTYTEIKSVSTPAYEFKAGGKGKAEANLQISVVPSIQINTYEAVTNKLVLEHYLAAAAGVEGFVQVDALVDPSVADWKPDADYRLTKATMSGGIRAWLYANLHILGKELLVWPRDANAEQYTTFKKLDLVDDTPFLGIPLLDAAVDYAAALRNGDSRAIKINSTAGNVPDPLKLIFPSLPDSFVPWAQWTPPRIVPPPGVASDSYSVISSPSGNEGKAETWVLLKQPGTYTVRIGGYGEWGNWARQYTDVQVTARVDCRPPQVLQNGDCIGPSPVTVPGNFREHFVGLLAGTYIGKCGPLEAGTQIKVAGAKVAFPYGTIDLSGDMGRIWITRSIVSSNNSLDILLYTNSGLVVLWAITGEFIHIDEHWDGWPNKEYRYCTASYPGWAPAPPTYPLGTVDIANGVGQILYGYHTTFAKEKCHVDGATAPQDIDISFSKTAFTIQGVSHDLTADRTKEWVELPYVDARFNEPSFIATLNYVGGEKLVVEFLQSNRLATFEFYDKGVKLLGCYL